MAQDSTGTDYLPGSCNIGKREVRQRQVVALIGAVLTVIAGIGLLSNEDPNPPRFFIFFPAMIFAIGFVQSRKKFCLAYGFAGTFNMGSLGKISKVASAADKKADRKMAIKIMQQSVLLALGITIAFTTLGLVGDFVSKVFSN
jgi:hypothetical protein